MDNFMDAYEPVQDRIERFYKDHPKGRIITLLQTDPSVPERVVFAASLFREGEERPFATGHAAETSDKGMVNKQGFALENCETSAIGRALANAGYCPKGPDGKGIRPSAEEMRTVERRKQAPVSVASTPPQVDGELMELAKKKGITSAEIAEVVQQVFGAGAYAALDQETKGLLAQMVASHGGTYMDSNGKTWNKKFKPANPGQRNLVKGKLSKIGIGDDLRAEWLSKHLGRAIKSTEQLLGTDVDKVLEIVSRTEGYRPNDNE